MNKREIPKKQKYQNSPLREKEQLSQNTNRTEIKSHQGIR